MKLLDRYLLRCYRGPVFYCLSAFSIIFVVSRLFGNLSRLMDARPPVPDILLYYLCQLAPALEYLIPASLLLATLYTLWQLSRKNELIAMRSSGISLYRIMVPLLTAGVLFSLATSVIKETVAPAAMIWADEFANSDYQRMEHDLRRNVAFYNTADRRLWLIGTLDMKNPHVFLGVKVTQERSDGTRSAEWRTRKAEWLDGQWWFHDTLKVEYDSQDNPVGELQPLTPEEGSIIEMDGFGERPTDIVNDMRDWMYLSTAQMLRYLAAHPRISEEALAQKTYDIHARAAMPWACLIVILFGIPAGTKGGRHSALAGVFLAVAFFFAFYALSQVGLFMAKRQMISPWIGAWLSNMVFLAAGVVMLTRIR